MGRKRFGPRSAAKNSRFGCDNAGRPTIERTANGEVYLEMTPIPRNIQAQAEEMFREFEKQESMDASGSASK